MRKQVGRIYCRDLSKSPDHKTNICQPPQRNPSPPQDAPTMRKQPGYLQKLEGLRQNSNHINVETNRSKSRHFESVSSAKSQQFSSIHSSSLVSDVSEDLKQLKLSKRDNVFIDSEVEQSVHDSCFADSLAVYENPITRNNEIVRKLSHLNNIFKQMKILRGEHLSKNILDQVNDTQRELIEVERSILRNC